MRTSSLARAVALALALAAAPLVATAAGAATAPSAPTNLTAVASGDQVLVQWSAPASPGTSPVAGYTVTASPGSADCVTPASTTSCTLTGLAGGTTYTLSVTATSADGTGPAATTTVTTADTVPSAPSITEALPGDGAATVAWTTPATGGSPITGYVVTASPGGASCATSASSCVVTGLANGTTYDVSVVAQNALGDSAPSTSASVTPGAVPGPPGAPTATPTGPGTLTLAWSAPLSDGGSAITGYVATVTDETTPGPSAQCVAPAAALSCVVTGLTAGDSYVATVAATNATGSGPASAASAPVSPYGDPGAPTGLAAAVTPSAVTLVWSAPASDGGSPVTGYEVETQSVGATIGDWSVVASPATTTVTLAGPGGYDARVAAVTAAGVGPYSSPVAVELLVAPPAPTTVVAFPNLSGTTTVYWVPGPLVGLAAPPSDYVVTATDVTTPSNPPVTCTSATTSCGLTGLASGDAYDLAVVAENAAGSSPAATATVTADVLAPGAPGTPSVTFSGTSATVTWSPSSTTGATYLVELDDLTTGVTAPGCQSDTPGCALSGLVPGDTYVALVVATAPNGTTTTSAPSSAVVVAGAPDAPRAPTVTVTGTTATLSWLAPLSTGGDPVTGYTVTLSPGSFGCVTATTSCAVSGLTLGTDYVASIVATTAAGPSSPALAPVTTTAPAATPTSPTSPTTLPPTTLPPSSVAAPTPARLSAAWSGTTLTVTWPAPSVATSYLVVLYPSGVSCVTTTTSCAFAGLAPAGRYRVAVTALTALGTATTTLALGATPRPLVAVTPARPLVAGATRRTGSAALTLTRSGRLELVVHGRVVWRITRAGASRLVLTRAGHLELLDARARVLWSLSRPGATALALTSTGRLELLAGARVLWGA